MKGRNLFSLFSRKNTNKKIFEFYDSISHYPVMYREVNNSLQNNPEKQARFLIADCTFGGGGGIDLDESLINFGNEKFQRYVDEGRLALFHGNFMNLEAFEIQREFPEFRREKKKLDAVLLDLGYNDYQLKTQERGFSYLQPSTKAQLDMRYDRESETTAADILNNATQLELQEIFKNFAQEKRYRQLVSGIIKERDEIGKRFHTTQDLVKVLTTYQPNKAKEPQIKFLSRCFQALRIAVNFQLLSLQRVLTLCPNVIEPGGIVLVIEFHSLEGRIIETQFKEWEKRGIGKRVERLEPSKAEVQQNIKSRSARLRVFQLAPQV